MYPVLCFGGVTADERDRVKHGLSCSCACARKRVFLVLVGLRGPEALQRYVGVKLASCVESPTKYVRMESKEVPDVFLFLFLLCLASFEHNSMYQCSRYTPSTANAYEDMKTAPNNPNVTLHVLRKREDCL